MDDVTPELWALVQREVARMLRRLPPHVDRNEIESAAAFGLVQAARTFRADLNVPFPAYATQRIRGTILDMLRDRNHTRCKRQLTFLTLDTVGVESIEDTGESGWDQTYHNEQRRYLYEKIREIAYEPHRRILTSYLQGEQLKDIAEELGATQSLPSVVIKGKTTKWKQELEQKIAACARGWSSTLTES